MERANGIPLQNAHVQACILNDGRTEGVSLNRHSQNRHKGSSFLAENEQRQTYLICP